jgi:hypothetical protein
MGMAENGFLSQSAKRPRRAGVFEPSTEKGFSLTEAAERERNVLFVGTSPTNRTVLF